MGNVWYIEMRAACAGEFRAQVGALWSILRAAGWHPPVRASLLVWSPAGDEYEATSPDAALDMLAEWGGGGGFRVYKRAATGGDRDAFVEFRRENDSAAWMSLAWDTHDGSEPAEEFLAMLPAGPWTRARIWDEYTLEDRAERLGWADWWRELESEDWYSDREFFSNDEWEQRKGLLMLHGYAIRAVDCGVLVEGPPGRYLLRRHGAWVAIAADGS